MKTAKEIKEMMDELEKEENDEVLTKGLNAVEDEIISKAMEGKYRCSIELDYHYESSIKILREHLESLGYKVSNTVFAEKVSFEISWFHICREHLRENIILN